ncbi:MAG: radical SAM protein [Candidatus Altiarchaeota archaeon]
MSVYDILKLAAVLARNRFYWFNLADPVLYKLDVAVTYRCNSRCIYCNSWKTNGVQSELDLSDYRKIFDNLGLSWLHLTGGEPFLRDDFSDIVISAYNSMENLLLIDTSTNGILTDKILAAVRRILENVNTRFEIGVSLDGKRGVHDSIRGLRGAFDNAIRTYSSLSELSEGYSNFNVHINYVISPANLGELSTFIDEMRAYGIMPEDISVEVARASEFFKNPNDDLVMDYNKVMTEIDCFLSQYGGGLKSFFNPRHIVRRLYIKYMRDYLKTGRRIPCAAGVGSLFINPYGLVFPCSAMQEPVGNLRERNLSEILNSNNMKKWRKEYKNCKLCWSGCEGVTSILGDIPQSFLKLLVPL